jgi:hypothetical protein
LPDVSHNIWILSATKIEILQRVMRFLCSKENNLFYNVEQFVDTEKTMLVKSISIGTKEAALIGLWHPKGGVAAFLGHTEEEQRTYNPVSHSTWLFESHDLLDVRFLDSHTPLSRLELDFGMDKNEDATTKWIDEFLTWEPSQYLGMPTAISFPDKTQMKNATPQPTRLPAPPTQPQKEKKTKSKKHRNRDRQSLQDMPPVPSEELIHPYPLHPVDTSTYPAPPSDKMEPLPLPRPPRLSEMYPPPGMMYPPPGMMYPPPGMMYPLPPYAMQPPMMMPPMHVMAERIHKYTNMVDIWGPRLRIKSGEDSDVAVEAVFRDQLIGFPMREMDGDALRISHIIWDEFLRPTDGELALPFFDMLEYMQTHDVAVYDHIKGMKEQYSQYFKTCTPPSECCSVFFCSAPANPYNTFNRFMYCNQAALSIQKR